MNLLEDRFILSKPEKPRFCVSTQHYTFTANAFVEMVQKFGQERFEFILNETQTHQILEDVKNRFCDLGIIYLCMKNETFLRKTMDEMGLSFYTGMRISELYGLTLSDLDMEKRIINIDHQL